MKCTNIQVDEDKHSSTVVVRNITLRNPEGKIIEADIELQNVIQSGNGNSKRFSMPVKLNGKTARKITGELDSRESEKVELTGMIGNIGENKICVEDN